MKKICICIVLIIINFFLVSCREEVIEKDSSNGVLWEDKEKKKEKPEEDIIDRMVYLNGQNTTPSYNVWEKLINRPEIESYTIMGMIDGKLGKKEGYFIISDTRLETEGVKSMGFKIVEGEELNIDEKEKCLISQELADKNKKQVGDRISIKVGENKKNFLIGGVFALDRNLWKEKTNTSLLIDSAFITIEDFISLIGKEEEDSIMVTSIICNSSKEKEVFLEKANQILEKYHMKFLPLLREELYGQD